MRGGGSGRWPRAGPAPTLWAQRSPCPLCVPQGRPCRLLHSLSPWAGPVPQPQAGRGRGPWPWPPRLRRPAHSHGLPRPPPALLRSSWAATHPLAEQPAGSVSDVRCFLVGRGVRRPSAAQFPPAPSARGSEGLPLLPSLASLLLVARLSTPPLATQACHARECLLTQLLGGSGYLCAAGAQAVPSTRQVQGHGWASAMKGVAARCW